MTTRIILYAEEGKFLTNGEIYGKTIYLAEGLDESGFYEISDEEYEKLMAEKEAEARDNV